MLLKERGYRFQRRGLQFIIAYHIPILYIGPLCGPNSCLLFGAVSELRVRFCASKIGLTLPLLNTSYPVLANSEDPDQLASDLDLHCLS